MTEDSNSDNPSIGKVGEYSLVSKIAEGGMGAVYLGKQDNTGRQVAVKILPRKMVSDGVDSIVRFQQEIATLARLIHPNIVSILGCGETEEGDPWYAMEYVDGETLDEHIRRGGLTTDHVYDWIPQLCDALGFAHEKGIVHRDIKPANILVSKTGQVKIVDFGLAKHMDAKQSAAFLKTQIGVSLGTPDFISPEQLDPDRAVDGRADIYSLGVLLYNFLTTKLPKANWKMPSEVVPGLPVEFDRIVNKSLEDDPDDRFATVEEFRKALESVPKQAAAREEEESSTAPVQARARQSNRGARRNTEAQTRRKRTPLVAAAVFVALAVVGFGGWKIFFGEKPDTGSDSATVAAVSESPEVISDSKGIPEAKAKLPPVQTPVTEKAKTPPKKNEVEKTPPSSVESGKKAVAKKEPKPAQKDAKTTEEQPSRDIDSPVDLLQFVDLSRNPNWMMEDGKLVSPECGYDSSDLPSPEEVKGLPIPFSFPDRYQLRLKVSSKLGTGMKLYVPLPKGRSAAVYIAPEMGVGIGDVHLREGNPTKFKEEKSPIGKDGVPNLIVVNVADGQFDLLIDGRKLIEWEQGESEDQLGGKMVNIPPVLPNGEATDLGLWPYRRFEFEEITLLPFGTPITEPEPASAEVAPAVKLTGPVDLLQHIDVSVNPNWKMEGGKLVSPESKHDDPALPTPESLKGISIPFDLPDSYSLRMRLSPNFSKPGGNTFYLPVGGERRLSVYADRSGSKYYGWPGRGARAVLANRDIKDSENPSFIYGGDHLFPTGFTSEVIFDVHPDRFTMEVDGGTALHWERGASDEPLGSASTGNISLIAGLVKGGLSIFSVTGYTYEAIELFPFRDTPPAPKLDLDKRNQENAKKKAPVFTGPVDLLQHVDLSLNPNWKMDEGVLISPECSYGNPDLPGPEVVKGILIPFPLPESFELRMKGRILHKRSGGCRIFLPVGTKRATVLNIDGTEPKLWKGPGTYVTIEKLKEDNPSLYTRQPITEGGDDYDYTVTMQPGSFKFESSGRTIIDWKQEEGGPELGYAANKRVWANIDGEFGQGLALFMHVSYAIEELTVRPLSGEDSETTSTAEPDTPAPVNVEVNPVLLLRSSAADPIPPAAEEHFAKLAGPFEKAWKTRVTDVYENGLKKLNQSYLRALGQAQSKAATEDVDLEAAKAIRQERNGIKEGTFKVPHLDADGTPGKLVTLRTTYRDQLAKLQQERSASQRILLQQLDKQLSAIQNALTKSEKIDEALFVKERRAQIAALLTGKQIAESQPSAKVPEKPQAKPSSLNAAASEEIQIKRPEPGTLTLVDTQNGSAKSEWSKMSSDFTNISDVVILSGAIGAVIRGDGRIETFGDKYESSVKNMPPGLTNVVATSGETDPHGWRYALQEDGSFFHWGDWGRDVKLPEKFESVKEIRRSGFRAFHVVDGEGKIQIFGEEDHWPLPPKLRRLRDVKSVTSIEFSTVVLYEDGSVEILDPENKRFTKRDHKAADEIEDGVKLVSYLGDSRESLVLTQSGSAVALGWGDDFSLPDLPDDLIDIAIKERPHADREPIGAVRSASQGWIFFGRTITPELAAKLAENSKGFDRISIQHTFVFGIKVGPKAP